MLSTVVIVIGAGVIFLCIQIADSRSIQQQRRRSIRNVSYEENRLASRNYEHTEPVKRAISTIELEQMTSDYNPEFVVLSRCDYSSGYCRGNGDSGDSLREIEFETVRVWFKDLRTDALVAVNLKNHTKCGCAPSKSGQKHLWHKMIYHVEEEEENASTNTAISLRSTEEAPITEQLISLGFPSNVTKSINSGTETSSASKRSPRSHLKTMLILLLMLIYN